MRDRKIIYADDAIDAITNYSKFLWNNYHETCNLAGMIDAIEGLPSAQPTPCDVCRHNPPSSMDSKPCCVCPAEGRRG